MPYTNLFEPFKICFKRATPQNFFFFKQITFKSFKKKLCIKSRSYIKFNYRANPANQIHRFKYTFTKETRILCTLSTVSLLNSERHTGSFKTQNSFIGQAKTLIKTIFSQKQVESLWMYTKKCCMTRGGPSDKIPGATIIINKIITINKITYRTDA